jgi:hypothetical protein
MSLWTIKYNGEQKTLAEWGINNVKRKLVNQGIDTLTFNETTATMLSDPLFPAGVIVELFRGEVRWFYGRAEAAKRISGARSTGYAYTVSGPWWFLERMGFRQKWKFRTSTSDATLIERYSSYCILGTKVDGTLQSIRDQIREAVNYAIEQDAPLLLEEDDGDPYLPTLIPPSRDAWDMPVAEVIRTMLQSVPDVVAFFDYSTEEAPTLRFRRRADQEAVELPALDEQLVLELELQPREDLQIPGVVIYYLHSAVVDGQSYSQVTEDIYPPETTGREPKALVAAINLEGSTATYIQGRIECETIEAGSSNAETRAEWWKRRDPKLADAKVRGLTVTVPTPVRQTTLANQLIGQWASWMGGTAQEETIRAFASYEQMAEDGVTVLRTLVNQPIFVKITATSLASGVYNSQQSGTPGEAQPIGLAKALYEAASVLHYDGRIVLQQQTCEGTVGLGNVVNLSGGRTEWEAMRAQAYTIVEDIDRGRTEIEVGPSKNLGPDDYLELLRATRSRFRFAPPGNRATGIGAAGGMFLGEQIQRETPAAGYGGVTQQVWKDPSRAVSGSVTIDLKHAGEKALAIIEQRVCINNDENWFMRIIASEPYRREEK